MTQRASACGKVILLGEHAVVYGHPAIAIPVSTLRARTELTPITSGFTIKAPDIQLTASLADLPSDHPLAFCVRSTARSLDFPLPSAMLRIESDIPVASGLGSGAAVSTAIVRVLAAAAGRSLSPSEISQIVYEVEKLYHGTPSGVDNTVIAYEQPIFFRRGEEPAPLRPGVELHWIIADSGIRSETRIAVAGVRDRWQQDAARYNSEFLQIGRLVNLGRDALLRGNARALGQAMNECHQHLREIGVSLPELDHLTETARHAGALGAKLSGAGLGGNVVALADAGNAEAIQSAFLAAGATRTFKTMLP